MLLCVAIFAGSSSFAHGQTDDEQVDGNTECSDSPVYGYRPDLELNKVYIEAGVQKLNLYGKACVSIEADDKAGEGKCEGPLKCHVSICDGKPCKLPDVKVDQTKNPLLDTSLLKPPTDIAIPKTSLDRSSTMDGFFDPAAAQQPSAISPSAESVEEQIKKAAESPGLFSSVKDKWNSFFSSEPDKDSRAQLSDTGIVEAQVGLTDGAPTVDTGATPAPPSSALVQETTGFVDTSAPPEKESWSDRLSSTWDGIKSTVASAGSEIKDFFAIGGAEAKPGPTGPENDPNVIGQQRFDITGYFPCKDGVSCPIQGNLASARPGPDGEALVRTLDDYRLGKSEYVTGASDMSRVNAGEKYVMPEITYKSPIDGKTYTLNDVPVAVHDTGSAFQGRPDKLDIAVGVANSDANAQQLARGQEFLGARYQTYDRVASLEEIARQDGAGNPANSSASQSSLPPAQNPRIAESAYGPVWQPDVSASIYAADVRPIESGTLPDITPDYAAMVPSDIFNNSNSEFFAAGRDMLDSRNIPDEIIASQLPPLETIDDGESITARMNNELQLQDRLARADAENPETPPTFNERFAPTEQLPISTADIDTKTEAQLQADVAANKELMKDLADSRQPPAPPADDRPWWQRFLTPEPSSVERAAVPVVVVESPPLPDISPRIEPAEIDLGMTPSERAAPTGVVTSEPLLDITPNTPFAERVPDSMWKTEASPAEAPASFNDRFAAAPATAPESSETRQTFSPEAIALQEQALQKNLEDQTRLLQETSGTLSEDAVARGIAACESAPSGRLCRSYQTYNVAVQTEQLKYDAIVANYDSFVSYKNGGSLNANLTRSLAEIEKGQGTVSAAIDSYAKPYQEAAKEWFAPIAESYKESDWATFAKESWKSVPALGNMVWGGLSTDIKIVGERLPLGAGDALGFSPAPEEAARCGAVGQGICDAEGAVSAGNVVGAVWGTGAIAKGIGSAGSEFVRQVGRTFDDVAETTARQADNLPVAARIEPVPTPAFVDDAARTAPDVPRAPELAPDTTGLPMQRVADDISNELNTSAGRTVREQVDDDLAFIRAGNEAPASPRVPDVLPETPIPRDSLVATVREMDAAQRKLDNALQEFQFSRTVANDPTPPLGSREAALRSVEEAISDVKKFDTPETNLGTAELQSKIDSVRAGMPDAEQSFRNSLQHTQDEIKATILDKRADAGIVDRIQLAFLDSRDSVTDFASGVFSRRTAEPPAGLNDNIVPTEARAVGETRTTGIGTLAEQNPNLSLIRGGVDNPTTPSPTRATEPPGTPPVRTEPAPTAEPTPIAGEVRAPITAEAPAAQPTPWERIKSLWTREEAPAAETIAVRETPPPRIEEPIGADAPPIVRDFEIPGATKVTEPVPTTRSVAEVERPVITAPTSKIEAPLGADAPPIVRDFEIRPVDTNQPEVGSVSGSRVPNVGQVTRNAEPPTPGATPPGGTGGGTVPPTGGGTAPPVAGAGKSFFKDPVGWMSENKWKTALIGGGLGYAYINGPDSIKDTWTDLKERVTGTTPPSAPAPVAQVIPPANDPAKVPAAPAPSADERKVVPPPAPHPCGPNETFASSGCTSPYKPYTPPYSPVFAPAVQNPNGQVVSQDTFCMTSTNPVVVVPVTAGTSFPSNCYNSPTGGSSSSGILAALMQRAFAPQPPQQSLSQTPSQGFPQTPPFIPPTQPPVPPTPVPAAVALIANPSVVEVDGTSLLSWASIGTKTCEIGTPADGETLVKDGKPDGSMQTPKLDITTVFRIKCTTAEKDIFATTTVRVK